MNYIKVKIKKVNPDAKIPEYAHPGDAGMDIYAVSKEIGETYIEYKTGLSFELPLGYVMLIFPRSSVSKKDLIMANSVGVLDQGFRGELTIRFKRTGKGENKYEVGERVAQLMIIPFPQVEFEEVKEISESSRGFGGWGSTGN